MTKALIRNPYLMRLLMIAVICSGISLWFLRDGMFTYPTQRAWALEFEKNQDLDREAWKKIARENGWPPDRLPGEPKTQADIYEQYAYGIVLGIPGILYFIFLAQYWGRWIESTESGLKTSRGQAFDYAAIQSLNKTKWKKKGIAKITYNAEGGTKKLTLDDWKYDTDATLAILRDVEANISEEIVSGGPLELPPVEADESEDLDEGDQESEPDATRDATDQEA